MKTIKLTTTLVSLFLLTIISGSYGKNCLVVKSGNWNQKSIWKDGQIPVCGDSVHIGKDLVVEISDGIGFNNCNNSFNIKLAGTLTFRKGGSLILGCNSVISIQKGGVILQDKSNKPYTVRICDSKVLLVSSGNIYGPLKLHANKKPVEVLHFTGKPEGEDMVLTWATVEQINNKSFIIEKGKNGVDYTELARVNGAGTSKNIHSYKMIDKNPFNGKQYYRLKQLNTDGTIVTHKVIAVDYVSQTTFKIFPNPTFGELYANISPEMAGEKGQLVVNNSNGKHMLTKEIATDHVTNGIQLLGSTESLPKGDYLVTLNFKSKTFTQYVICK